MLAKPTSLCQLNVTFLDEIQVAFYMCKKMEQNSYSSSTNKQQLNQYALDLPEVCEIPHCSEDWHKQDRGPTMCPSWPCSSLFWSKTFLIIASCTWVLKPLEQSEQQTSFPDEKASGGVQSEPSAVTHGLTAMSHGAAGVFSNKERGFALRDCAKKSLSEREINSQDMFCKH